MARDYPRNDCQKFSRAVLESGSAACENGPSNYPGPLVLNPTVRERESVWLFRLPKPLRGRERTVTKPCKRRSENFRREAHGGVASPKHFHGKADSSHVLACAPNGSE